MKRLILFLAACGGSDNMQSPDGSSTNDGTSSGPGLSDMYPGDMGIGGDPAVIWFEDFEASLATITARYDQAQGMSRMQIGSDAARGNAIAMTAGNGVDAVDLYKQLPDHDDVFIRWYAKYDSSVPWHHSGMWFGGYNPGMPYPSPMAGYKPNGDDRFSFSIEPVWGSGTASARFDFYNYWMKMHSWMTTITNDGTSYYGNSIIHQRSFTLDETQWVCLEVHVKLNTSGGSAAGAMIEVWKNDGAVVRFDGASPMGWWIRDKFCPANADGTECTDYPAPANEVLDLQFRSTTSYGINALWPQNYITDPAMGTLRFDQIVVATTRVGCMR